MDAIIQNSRTDQQVLKVQQVLKYTYGLVPIVAGLDKFTNLLTNWEGYLGQPVIDMLPFGAATFMAIIGVVEIIAGVLVLMRPHIGGFVVMAWLALIALLLISSGRFFDVAVRDLVMAIGAYALAKLSVPASPRAA